MAIVKYQANDPFSSTMGALSDIAGGFVKTSILLDRQKRETERLQMMDKRWRDEFDFRKQTSIQDQTFRQAEMDWRENVHAEGAAKRTLDLNTAQLNNDIANLNYNKEKNLNENLSTAYSDLYTGMSALDSSDPQEYARNGLNHIIQIASAHNIGLDKLLPIGKEMQAIAQMGRPKVWQSKEVTINGKLGWQVIGTDGRPMSTIVGDQWSDQTLQAYNKGLDDYKDAWNSEYDKLKAASQLYRNAQGNFLNIGEFKQLTQADQRRAMLDMDSRLQAIVEERVGSQSEIIRKRMKGLNISPEGMNHFLEQSGVGLKDTSGKNFQDRSDYHYKKQKATMGREQKALGAEFNIEEYNQKMLAHIDENMNTSDDYKVAMQMHTKLMDEYNPSTGEPVPVDSPLGEAEAEAQMILEAELGRPEGTMTMGEIGKFWADKFGAEIVPGPGPTDPQGVSPDLTGLPLAQQPAAPLGKEFHFGGEIATEELPPQYQKTFDAIAGMKISSSTKEIVDLVIADIEDEEGVELPPIYNEMFLKALKSVGSPSSKEFGVMLKMLIKETVAMER